MPSTRSWRTAEDTGRFNIVGLHLLHGQVLAAQGLIDAARVCGDAIAHAGPGCAGWVLPIDPLLQPTAHGDCWAQTLAMLRDRAT